MTSSPFTTKSNGILKPFKSVYRKDEHQLIVENISKRIIAYLQENNVSFKQLIHSSAGSVEEYRQTMGTRLEQLAKALFVREKILRVNAML